ncbi:MAG TPA: winged helix-turn-helix domain-containing protein [Trebonia sp.]|nr:winged helix-turn-helix domain-containing protein [Trebonia sp.]
MRIGTQLLPRPEADLPGGLAGDPPVAPGTPAPGTPAPGTPGAGTPGAGALTLATLAAGPPGPGADGTLLAIVPIPGTKTSLAIVGYPVSNELAARAAGGEPAGTGSIGEDATSAGPEPVAGAAGLLLDHDQRRVWADGQEIPLTFQEFELLAFLSAHPATVFSRADLVARAWQRDFAADSRTVDVHVSRLRHKLGPHYGRYLVTEYRVGYQFRTPGPADADA